jgi:hypothetical protein
MAFGDLPKWIETRYNNERNYQALFLDSLKQYLSITPNQFRDLITNKDATKTTLQIWGSGEELQKKIMKIYNGLVKFGSVFYVPDYYTNNDPHIIVIRTPQYMKENGYV